MEVYFDESEALKSYDDDVNFTPAQIRAKFAEWLNTLEVKTKEFRFLQFLNKGFQEIEAENKLVQSVHMSAIVYATFRTLGKDFFDEAGAKEIIARGVYGRLWTADIIVRPNLGEKIIFSSEKYIKK